MSRSKSREFAIQILYQVELVHDWQHPLVVCKTFFLHKQAKAEVKEYTRDLISGIVEQKSAIDRLIDDSLTGMALADMAIIDRNTLRIAVYELFFSRWIPIDVAINEGINLAKKFGNERSGALVNAILDDIRKKNRAGLTAKQEL